MIRINFIFLTSTIILSSCLNSTKQNTNGMVLKTTENNNGNFHLTYESKSVSSSELATDLETILEKLNSTEIVNSKQLLFYIDGTNGNIFISGFNELSGEVYDDNGIWVELVNLWEDNNSMDFDQFVTESIEIVFKTKLGLKTKKKYDLYYQTEEDGPEKVK